MDPIIRKKQVPGGVATAWEGYLTIQHVSAWKEVFLKESYPMGSKLSIDLSKIQRIDTAGAQLLVFIKKYCAKNQIQLNFLNHSTAILKVFDVLGLIGFFGDKIKVNKQLTNEFDFSYGTKREVDGSI
jgi:anti-anti-sigma factor